MVYRRSRIPVLIGCIGVLGLLAVALANCTSDGLGTSSSSPASTPAYAAAEGVDAAALQPTAETVAMGDYRISGRDILDIQVFQVTDLNKTVQVSEDGSVTLPLVGKMLLGGKTTQEAEEVLSMKLKQKYLQSPQVSVLVKQFGQRVTVSGEVKGAKVLAVDGSTTLTQAIANAGGLTDVADATRVHVARSRTGHVSDAVYNLNDIQAGKLTDPVLQGGDIVVAEQSGTRVAFKTVKDLLPFAVLSSVL